MEASYILPIRRMQLDEDLDDLIVLEDRDPRLVIARGDDHLLVHEWNSIGWTDPSFARETA